MILFNLFLYEQMALSDIGIMISELGLSYEEALEGLRAMLRDEVRSR